MKYLNDRHIPQEVLTETNQVQEIKNHLSDHDEIKPEEDCQKLIKVLKYMLKGMINFKKAMKGTEKTEDT